MAKFNEELPYDLLKAFEDLEVESGGMIGEMCLAGAGVVYEEVFRNIGTVFETTASLDKGLKMTKVYKTPSDDGTNVHIGFYGYNDKGVPIPLIAQAREYGTSSGEQKKPFFRKAFKKKAIEQAMQTVQDKYIKGD